MGLEEMLRTMCHSRALLALAMTLNLLLCAHTLFRSMEEMIEISSLVCRAHLLLDIWDIDIFKPAIVIHFIRGLRRSSLPLMSWQQCEIIIDRRSRNVHLLVFLVALECAFAGSLDSSALLLSLSIGSKLASELAVRRRLPRNLSKVML